MFPPILTSCNKHSENYHKSQKRNDISDLSLCRELYSEEDKESVIGAVSGITAFSQSFG